MTVTSSASGRPRRGRVRAAPGGAVVLAAALAGCRPAAGPAPAAATAFPPELANARVLYQRPDGVYLRRLAAPSAERLAGDAAYPRWAPDGGSFAFLRGNRVMLYRFADRSERELAAAAEGRAVAFHPDGREVWFTDGTAVKAVAVAGGAPRTVLSGTAVLELGIAPGGRFLAATVPALGGYRVARFDLPGGARRDFERGCSAGVTADGGRITVNLRGHTRLALLDARTGETAAVVAAPEGLTLDNQKWSNHPDWLAAVTEGRRADVVVQRAADGQAWRVTDTGDADRPDLRIE